MKRNLIPLAILFNVCLLLGVAPAQADVTILGANSFKVIDGGLEDSDNTVNNIFTVAGNLTIATGGSITCDDNAVDQPLAVIVPNSSACPITIVVTGNLLMEAGSTIRAQNNVAGGSGANVSITVDGNVILSGSDQANPGALVSSRKIAGAGDTGIGGNITIHAGDTTCSIEGPEKGDVMVEVGAQILADSPGNAGDIEILSGRNITVAGKISSNNSSTVGRAGRITLIACCDLVIDSTGIVSSRGSDPGADLVHIEGCTVVILGLVESTGAGHNDAGTAGIDSLCNDGVHVPPPGYTKFRACVEIWAANTLLIDASSTYNGQVSAEATKGNDNNLNKGSGWIDLYANGNITIKGNTIEPFAVHANMLGANTAQAGVITIKSGAGNVVASDLAVQADASLPGGKGGRVTIEGLEVDLDTASVFARGDFNSTGGYGKGGTQTIRAFTLGLSWTGGIGDVQPTGTSITAASRGVITLSGCPVTTTGTSFPFTGTSTMPASSACPGGSPVIAEPAGARLAARVDCVEHCEGGGVPEPPPFCVKTPVRTILDPANGRYPLNQGPDVLVRVDLGDSIQMAVSDAAMPGFDAAHNNDGYIIIAVSAKADQSLGGHVTQGVDITDDYEYPFALIGCSVTMHDPAPADATPTAHIDAFATSPEWPVKSGQNIFVMDLHAADSKASAGWKIEGDGRYVRNTYGTNSAVGVWFVGNYNVMHNGKGEANTIGIRVDGNKNTITGPDAMANGTDGVYVRGNGNRIEDVDAGDRGKGNGGQGFNVLGSGNQLTGNSAFANGGNGFLVGSTVGSPNLLMKNQAGDRGKGNVGHGFVVNGAGTGAIDLEENSAKANGLNGFWFTSFNHKLKKNISGGSGAFPGGQDNGKCEFKFDAANLDGSGNKANNANATAFSAGTCKGTP